MNFYRPVGPRCVNTKDEFTPFTPEYMYDEWKEHMPHLRFRHMVRFRKVSLLKKLKLVLEMNVGPHANVIVGDSVYKCQVLQLLAYSTLFKDNVQRKDLFILPENLMSNECFEMVYGWMISDQIYCPRKLLLDLLVAAEHLQCQSLAEVVYKYLDDQKHYSELKAFACFLEAQRKDMIKMADMMLSRVGKSFLALVCMKEFWNMDINCLRYLLSSNNLAVQSEIEVFYSALYWLLSKFRRRKGYIENVLSLVRFQMMPPGFLLLWAQNLKNLQPELADHICVCIGNAMLKQEEHHEGKFVPELHGRDNRNWVRDSECPYEYILDRNGCYELTVEVFLRYMRRVRKTPGTFHNRLTIAKDYKVLSARKDYCVYEPLSFEEDSRCSLETKNDNDGFVFEDYLDFSDSDMSSVNSSEDTLSNFMTDSEEDSSSEEDTYFLQHLSSETSFVENSETNFEAGFVTASETYSETNCESTYESDSSRDSSRDSSQDSSEHAPQDPFQDFFRGSSQESCGDSDEPSPSIAECFCADSETDSAKSSEASSNPDCRTDSNTDSSVDLSSESNIYIPNVSDSSSDFQHARISSIVSLSDDSLEFF
ncbi:uncharacterized protein [Drosophila takahashii]|uniref:uncharacterized protein isoform X1 n=2 Tax=Drosophila takahashii TaxID=29030 RepID=UPI003898DF8E